MKYEIFDQSDVFSIETTVRLEDLRKMTLKFSKVIDLDAFIQKTRTLGGKTIDLRDTLKAVLLGNSITVVSDMDIKLKSTKSHPLFQGSDFKVISLRGVDFYVKSEGTDMFSQCHAEEIILPSKSKVNLKSTSGMFYRCRRLKKLNIENLYTQKIKDMSRMFQEVWNIESLDLSNFDTSNVVSMEYMFYTSKFKDLDVSKFNTSKVTNMHGMFSHLTLEGTLDLSNFDMSNVVNRTLMLYKTEATKIIYGDVVTPDNNSALRTTLIN